MRVHIRKRISVRDCLSGLDEAATMVTPRRNNVAAEGSTGYESDVYPLGIPREIGEIESDSPSEPVYNLNIRSVPIAIESRPDSRQPSFFSVTTVIIITYEDQTGSRSKVRSHSGEPVPANRKDRSGFLTVGTEVASTLRP